MSNLSTSTAELWRLLYCIEAMNRCVLRVDLIVKKGYLPLVLLDVGETGSAL